MIGQIVDSGFDGIFLVASNPVDILTYATWKYSKFPANKVIGTGTTLDSSRFKKEIANLIGIDPRSVEAFIMGEHGDSEFAVWSHTNVGGMPLYEWVKSHSETDEKELLDTFEKVKNAAYEIIDKKGATFYGIGMALARLVEAIINDQNSVFSTSSYLDGEYGLEDIFIGAPSVIGKNGVKWVLEVPLTDTEDERMKESAKTLKELYPIGFSLSGLSKVFGSLGIMAAFIKTSKPERRKKVIALMIPATLTAVLTGVTEPLEFTFLFIAPILFVVHAVLDATLQMLAFALGVVGDFGGGIINWVVLNWLPLGIYHYKTYIIQVVLGVIFAVLYFLIFNFLIRKMNLKTPGREEGSKETKLYYKKDYQNKKAEGNKSKEYYDASAYLDLLGGKENVEAVTNCATRLRVSVKDNSLVADEENFKDVGAYGLVKQGNNMQIIVGTQVSFVREEFENILKGE